MGGYEIGISGLHAAQNALDVIGNNIANAATEGYHRQEVDLRPKDDAYTGGYMIGQGVDFAGIKRRYDSLLESEILRQESSVSQIDRELDTLRTMESSFAELATPGFSSAMDSFFNSLHDLSAMPSDVNLQNMAVSAAETLAFQLRSAGDKLIKIEDGVYTEAGETVDEINLLAGQIAALNNGIRSSSIAGDDVNNLLDQRSALITQMSGLIGIKTYEKEYNVIDVNVGDTSLVLGSSVMELQIGLVSNSGEYDLAIAPAGTDKYSTDLSGGKLGGLFNLRNSIVRDAGNKLDTLAQTVITQMNRQHAQGVGTTGAFTSLSGWTMTSETLSEFDPPVSDGTITMRITDSSGAVVRQSFSVDASTHTMTDIRNWLGGLTGISNTQTVITSGKLTIQAETGYTFDFLGGAMTSPPAAGVDNTMAGFGGSAEPKVRVWGNYKGTANETYTFTVVTTPAAQTGLTIGSGSMVVEVRNAANNLVTTINVGDGYIGGTPVTIEEGLKMSFDVNGSSAGYLNDGELFRISALADSDTSGVLAAMGMNAFFSGTTAASIAVSDRVKDTPGNIAVYGHAERGDTVEEMTGNENVLAMARMGETAMSGLGAISPKDYYRNLATDIGRQISINEIKHENAFGVWQNLRSQRDGVSGVDLNTEAMRMMVFERMFQSMAKYLNVVNKVNDMVMGIL